MDDQPPPQHAGGSQTTYSDSSGPIFSMYNTRVQKFDEENVENWKGSAESILVFTGLFSSTVASFISISYQNLQQDPNVTTQALLAQISQQIYNTTTADIGTATPSTDSSFVPSPSVVFINSVWFLSLILSLTCALIATLLQQWARRYSQMVQRNHAPHVRAHIREYFARGAQKFLIFELVEVLPFLLLVSVFLFFIGLVVFAFRGNHIVAYSALSIVAFCAIAYTSLTIVPLFSHDCPYQTPMTVLLWFSAQVSSLSFFWAAHLVAKELQGRVKKVSKEVVESLLAKRDQKVKSVSEGLFPVLEKSAKRISKNIYEAVLDSTLNLLDEDNELEEFAAGIPGLREAKALAPSDGGDDQRRTILAALTGPANFNKPLPWSIIGLAERVITSNLSEVIKHRRTQTCLRALYYIPGAIRDVLAPYAADASSCLEILPLLDSADSLQIVDELWNTLRDDVALSVRCSAAVLTTFIITPPRPEVFLNPSYQFIGVDTVGEQFLRERLGTGAGAYGDKHVTPNGNFDPDTARLQNLICFLDDFRATLGYESVPGPTLPVFREECDKLLQERSTARSDLNTRSHHHASPAFIFAAQHDLIALTLEILVRDSVAAAALPQREAFHAAYKELGQMARERAAKRENEPETLVELVDSAEMVWRSLEPVAQSLRLQMDDTPTPRNDDGSSPSPTPTQQHGTAVGEGASGVALAGKARRGSGRQPTLPMTSSASLSTLPPVSEEGRLNSPSALV